ncbi:MAG: DUF6712 family protein [Bacteroidota bacterium]
MGLIIDIATVREYANVETDLDLDKILPDLNQGAMIIRDLIGPQQFDELLTAYNNGTGILTEAQTTLLEKIQDPIVNIGLSFSVDSQQLKLANTGLQRHETAEFKSPFKYQTDNLKSFLLQRGYSASELLLEYLEGNTALFPTWAASPAYTINKEFYINSAKEFSKFYNIRNSRVTYMQMTSIMRYVDSLLNDVISDELALEIHGEVESATISDDNQVLLDKYLKPAFALATVSHSLHDLPINFVGDAILISQYLGDSEGKESIRPSQSAIDTKRIVVNDRAEYYTGKLRDYLNANASATKYAAYFNSDKYEDPNASTDEELEGSIYPAL